MGENRYKNKYNVKGNGWKCNWTGGMFLFDLDNEKVLSNF
jgi:hypothetical protein